MLGLGSLRVGETRFVASSRGFRRRRFALFLHLVDRVLDGRTPCRIIDIGGEPGYWDSVADLLGARRCHVTLVNLTRFQLQTELVEAVAGDARDLSEFSSMSFDLVHSNSVLEHVGCWPDMQSMAHEVRRLAPNYFVQTPYFWFPVEPHCATPFFHWLPEPVRLSLLLHTSCGRWEMAPDVETAMRRIQDARLLDRRMFAALFPDARIHRERAFGLTKSLIAVRTQGLE